MDSVRRNAELADEPREKRQELIRQNNKFCHALAAAIKDGKETSAGVTATVRTGRKKSAQTA
jgi:hypothetical protein